MRYFAGLVMIALVSPTLVACSFCPTSSQRNTLGREFEQAAVVLYGKVANPRLSLEPSALPGSGHTDFHIERVLKHHEALGKQQLVVLPRYVPLLDSQPAYFLTFFDVHKNKLDLTLGRAATPALAAYLEEAQAARAKGRMEALRYYAGRLDHADAAVAEDAFLELARSKDDEIGQLAKEMSPALVRRLLQQPNLDQDRLSLFAFLLGGCGGDDDARYLRSLIGQGGEADRAVDGILAGYIALRPKEGWDLAYALLGDSKQHFNVRFGALRTLRFYHGWRPKETHPNIVYALRLVIADGDLADMAIEDLRQWKAWDLTETILAQFGKPSHDAPITRRAIIRYALTCPSAEARAFVERIRPREAETIRDIEEGLAFEKQ